MEHQSATIALLVTFAILFTVAVIFVIRETPPDDENQTHDHHSSARVAGAIPKATPEIRDEDADPTFIKTPSGLKYRILRRSDGIKPRPEFAVAVAYKGWVDNGTIFDQTYTKPKGYYALEPPWSVIKGWTEGLQLVGEGGMIELEIPSELGYGGQSKRKIKPGSTLHFEVEILKVFKQ